MLEGVMKALAAKSTNISISEVKQAIADELRNAPNKQGGVNWSKVGCRNFLLGNVLGAKLARFSVLRFI